MKKHKKKTLGFFPERRKIPLKKIKEKKNWRENFFLSIEEKKNSIEDYILSVIYQKAARII